MKTLTLAAALAALATPGLAGGPTVVADDPVPAAMAAPAATKDWSGAYVGLSYGRVSGQMTYSFLGNIYNFESGAATSAYAGYLFQRGKLVYGGELAYGQSKSALTDFPDETLDKIIDVKAKVGYSVGKTLLYGAAGYSKVDYIFGTSGNQPLSGSNYGVGADIALGDKVTVGIEYLKRTVSGDVGSISGTRDINLDTVSLRVGLSF